MIMRRWVGVENNGKYLMHSFIYYLGGKHNTRNRKGRILKVDNEWALPILIYQILVPDWLNRRKK